ncbi:MAG: DinB family protein, partial [Candidatus Dormibacteria bacterium]
MTPLPRPPEQAGETETLLAFLDVQRAVVRWKLEDAPDEALRTVATPSGMTLIGLVRHLTDVERWWFRHQWHGEDGVVFHSTEDDEDADFRVVPEHTAAVVLAEYAQECARSDALVRAAASLDEPGRRRPASLRWVLVHMIEE